MVFILDKGSQAENITQPDFCYLVCQTKDPFCWGFLFHLHVLVGKRLTGNFAVHFFPRKFICCKIISGTESFLGGRLTCLDWILPDISQQVFLLVFLIEKNINLLEMNSFVEIYQGQQITWVKVRYTRRMQETQIHGLHQMDQRH